MSVVTETRPMDAIIKVLTDSKVLWIVNVLLGLVLLLFTSKLVYLLVPEPDVAEIRMGKSQSEQVAYSLYPEAEGSAGNLPEASIKAEVLGLVSSGAQSIATLVLEDGKQSVFRVGDEITRYVTIEAIDHAGVVVREQGVLRRISINRLGETQQLSLVQKDVGNKDIVDRSLIKTEAKQQPKGAALDALFDKVGVVVEVDNGSSGLRVKEVAASVSRAIDLQPGDFITDIDGTPVLLTIGDRSPRDLLASLLAEGESVTIDLLRDGTSQQIQIDQGLLNGSGHLQ